MSTTETVGAEASVADGAQASAAPAGTEAVARGRRKLREGIVVSDRMDKTRIVVVQEQKPHALYKKVVRINRRLKVHDESNEAHVGDRVRIAETRPLSKDKRWRLAVVLEKAK